jgi:RNA polymerase primary sigma factor
MWIKESEISAYLRDIRKIGIMTSAEEKIVIQRIKAGDLTAEHELINANLRFVITVAKEFQNQGLPFQDLISEGNYGLVKAAKRFNSDVGVRFYSYAVHWVRQSIIQALNDNSRTVRLPVNVINDMARNRKELEEKAYADWCVYQGIVRTQSLNQEMGESGEEFVNTLVGSYNDAFNDPTKENKALIDALKEVIDISCTPREQAIIKQYYGLDGEELTLQQIADDMKLTKERVRQIKHQAIKKLRFNAPMLFKFFQD